MLDIAGGIVLAVIAVCVLALVVALFGGLAASVWDAITDPGDQGYRGPKRPWKA